MDDVTWIDLLDPGPDEVTEALQGDVHSTVIRRLLAAPRHSDDPRPRLETQGTHLFGVLVVPVIPKPGDRVINMEVDLVSTADRLITVRKTPPNCEPLSFDDVRTSALAEGDSAGMCLYRVFDEVAERYLSLIDAFDDSIDELEDQVSTWAPTAVRERISELRHDILHVRRTLAPTRDAARAVLDDRCELPDTNLFPRDVELHFADAYDKLLRATDDLDLSRDL
ncbi:MAG TPA: CorA family divalent cation transporter, partial [Acidimicrobiales bacterium]